MKKYKLTKDVLQYVGHLHDAVKTLDEWIELGFNINALEEVPQRVKLNFYKPFKGMNKHTITRCDGDSFTYQEKDLFEKAINGELLDIDSLDDDGFERWYGAAGVCISMGNGYQIEGIKSVLKEYLKQC